jgi:hypothetical protein
VTPSCYGSIPFTRVKTLEKRKRKHWSNVVLLILSPEVIPSTEAEMLGKFPDLVVGTKEHKSKEAFIARYLILSFCNSFIKLVVQLSNYVRDALVTSLSLMHDTSHHFHYLRKNKMTLTIFLNEI